MPGYDNVTMLQGAQAALETTRGTGVTPNRWLYPASGGIAMTWNQEASDFSESTRSYHGRRTHALGLYSVDLTAEERASYEDLIFWFNMALAGGVTSGSAAGDGYEYEFVPASDADDLEFATIRAGDPSGVYEFTGCAVNELQLKFDPSADATWMLSASIMGNAMAANETFETLSDRTRNLILARGTKLYIDADEDDVGDTQLLGTVRSGQITIANNWERKAFLEDAETYSADMARGEQMITGEFTFEFLDDAQFLAMRSGTNRAIRIEQTGAVIGEGPGVTNFGIVIDIPNAKYNAPSVGFSGQNKVITFGIVAYASATNPAPISATVTVDTATMDPVIP